MPDDSRLDALIKHRFAWSWNQARERIRTGKISVNDRVETDPARPVSAHDRIVYTPNAAKPRASAAIGPEAIVHLDPHIVVVRKPAGMATVPFDEDDRDTLDQVLRDFLSRKTGHKGPGRGARPSVLVVHRLDKATSGILVFARTMLALRNLKAQFRAHTAHRRYLAIVHGTPTSRTIESHLLVDRGDGIRGSVVRAKKPAMRRTLQGKIAITHVEVIERFPDASLVACRLETGRTNQIRIHLSEAGFPLVGETLYLRGFNGPEIRAPRLMLHASELGFDHPVTLKPLRFEDPMPRDMQELLRRLKNVAG